VCELTGGIGSTRRLSWLEPRSASRTEPLSERAALADLDRVLEDSIRVHQRSDVPYGLFLSGGVDSTAIAVLMARLAERPVCAFTCGFEGDAVADERRGAERVAAALDLDWRETLFTEEDFWRLAPVAAAVLDDPTSDYACLPTLKLAEAAKGSLTVVLSGEGGDELFGGYGRYRRALRPAWLGGRPAEPQIATPLMTGDPAEEALAAWRKTARRVAPEEPLTRLQAAQAADIATWLPRDLLLKLDRCLMAHGLEGRTPFLDQKVAEFAFRLPDRMKVRGRYGKWLVRRWLETACPAFDPWGRKKGFTVPVAQWIAPRAGHLAARIASCPGLRPLYEPGAVEAIFTEEAHEAARWPLMFFCLWWDCHVEGLKPHEAGARLLGA
jgi:asparagine synthase (glutamine-hydrolysing)